VDAIKERITKTMKTQQEIDKEWDDFYASPMGKRLYRNYGDDSEDSDESFQKFCDYSGNNKYPTQ